MKYSKFKCLALSVALSFAGMVGVVAMPTPAAAAGTCTYSWKQTGNYTTFTINVSSCTGSSKASPFISYYLNDNTTRITTTLPKYVSSGSSTATRPSTSFLHSAWVTVT